MSQPDSFDAKSETEPPSRPPDLFIGSFISDVINRMGDGLQYSDYVNPSSNCRLSVDVSDYRIGGEIDQYEISRLLPAPVQRSAYALEKSVSSSMARAAAERGLGYLGEPDYVFPSFISTSNKGGFGLTSRGAAGILIGDRIGSNERPLVLRSEHIRTATELVILLGGLATLLTTIETAKHNLS